MPDTRTLIVLDTLLLIVLVAGAVIAYGKIQNLEQQVTSNPISNLLGIKG